MTYPAVAERPQPPTGHEGWTAGRVVSVVAGAVLLIGALVLVAGSTVALIWWGTQRDDGYLTSSTLHLRSAGYAVTTDQIELGATTEDLGHLLGTVRVRLTAEDPATPVFAGIAPSAQANSYLAGVAHSTVRQIDDGGTPRYRQQPGGPPPGPPADQRIWVAAIQTTGSQDLTWHVASGTWTVVVMRADGGPGVAASVALGATVPALPWIAGGVLVLGLLVGLAAVLLLVIPLRRVSRQLPPSGPTPTYPTSSYPPGSYPPGSYPPAPSGAVPYGGRASGSASPSGPGFPAAAGGTRAPGGTRAHDDPEAPWPGRRPPEP